MYDESSVIGMEHTTGGVSTRYYFQRNLLSDVQAIVNTNGTVVARYLYDAFGNCTIASSSTNTAVANANPIRYRGYYFDDDTGLYYCNARYYSPKWRRFISPDDTAYLDPESVNGLNLYCYCGNDPVNRIDPSGYDWNWGVFFNGLLMFGTAIGAIALSVTTFGAGIPLAMSIVAGVTLGAGVLTGVNGIATVIESGTGFNFMRDGLFNNVLGLSDAAYYSYAGITEGVATIGSMVLGFYHTTGQYKAAKYGQKFLGKGYKSAGRNRWVSNDGLKQMIFDDTHHLLDGVRTTNHFNLYTHETNMLLGKSRIINKLHVFYGRFNIWFV